MKYDFKQIMSMIDADWIKTYPNETKELIDALVHELQSRKDYIQAQRNQILLLKAMTLDSIS